MNQTDSQRLLELKELREEVIQLAKAGPGTQRIKHAKTRMAMVAYNPEDLELDEAEEA